MNRERIEARLGAAIIRLVGRSQRIAIDDPAGLLADRDHPPRIYAFWHNRLLLMPYLCRRYAPGDRVVVMVSRSRDGERIARIVERFGIGAVRGSTRRGGERALREMARVLDGGDNAAVTPDGPQGPRYRVQPGIVALAAMTGAPIVPVAWTPSRYRSISTWDGSIVPYPFARCRVRLGEPFDVRSFAGSQAEACIELEHRLLDLGERISGADR